MSEPLAATKARGDWKVWAQLGLSVAALALLIQKVNFHAILQRQATMQLEFAPLVLLAVVGQFVLSGWRWRYILRRMESPEVTLRTLLLAIGTSYFYGQLLPSSVGADVLRAARVARLVGPRKATLSVIVDRLSGLGVLAVWVGVTLPLICQRLGLDWRLIGAVELLVAIMALVLFMLFLPGRTGLARILFERRYPMLFHNVASDLARSIKDPKMVIVLAVTTFGMHLASVTLFYSVGRSVGAQIDYGSCLFLAPTALLASALPISFAGWGVREGVVLGVFSLVGLSQVEALTTSILYGLTNPVLGLVCVLTPLAFKAVRFTDKARLLSLLKGHAVHD